MESLENIEDSINKAGTMIPHIVAEDSPSVGEWQPSHEEVEAILKQKLAILEMFVAYDGRPPPAVEERCQALKLQVQSLEDDISRAGKSEAAIEYLRNAPGSHFQTVAHNDFKRWLESEIPLSPAIQDKAAKNLYSKKRKFPDSDDGFHVFSASSQNSSPDPSSARSKRIRTDGGEKHPCLRCRILKKKVC
ncbi:hypothetical protein DL98DRAFT_291278 [Cadophora sp. DSE1049]|nr:hypothetical protein DL98DRAFT_291278 [Cadophora sp. DSE1049]